MGIVIRRFLNLQKPDLAREVQKNEVDFFAVSQNVDDPVNCVFVNVVAGQVPRRQRLIFGIGCRE